MVRQNNSAATPGPRPVVDLKDDEQLVEEVTTTRRTGKQKVKAEAEPEEIHIAEVVEPEDEDPRDYSETSLAALVFDGEVEETVNQFCTIAVRRNPDELRDKFATPCTALTNLPPIRNVSLASEQMDIEDRVRSEYGGGHYFFQIRHNNRIGASWQSTLADLPAHMRSAPFDPNSTAPAQTPPPPAVVDPVTAFLDGIVKQKQLKDALFGDEQRRMENEIAELRREAEEARKNPSEPKSERLAMFEAALATQSGDLQGRLLDSLFPSEEKESRSTIAEVVDVVLNNGDKIMGLIGSLFGGGPPAQQQTQSTIADFMRAPAPSTLPPATEARGFRRRDTQTHEPEHTHVAEPTDDDLPNSGSQISDGSSSDLPVIDAEPEEPTNGKRKKRDAAA